MTDTKPGARTPLAPEDPIKVLESHLPGMAALTLPQKASIISALKHFKLLQAKSDRLEITLKEMEAANLIAVARADDSERMLRNEAPVPGTKKVDPKEVFAEHQAEDARKRGEDQWLETYNSVIMLGPDDLRPETGVEEAAHIANLTHGKRFEPACMSPSKALGWVDEPPTPGWYFVKQGGKPFVAYMTGAMPAVGAVYAGPLEPPK